MLVDLGPGQPELLAQAAALLVARMPEAWPTLDHGHRELRELLDPARIVRAYVRGRQVLGFVGARERYPGHVWEIFPLVVQASSERCGIGRTLVASIEATVAGWGIHSMFVASDDELQHTNLAGRDLYPEVLGHLATLAAVADHPVGFYQRLGYSVIGIMPDASGFGRHDIYLGKRLLSPAATG